MKLKKVREINFLITTNFPHKHFTYFVTTEIIIFLLLAPEKKERKFS